MQDIKTYPIPQYRELPMQKHTHIKKERKKEDLSFEAILKDKIKRRR